MSKYETLSGLSPEVEARAAAAVAEQLRVAVRDATARLHVGLGLTVGASVTVVARVLLVTIGTGFFAVLRGDLREDIEGMVSAVWKVAFAEARDAVRQVDERAVEAELAAKRGMS
jgi:hypothetical protein